MTKPNYTHVSILVDRSGSMSAIRSDAQGGINELIKSQIDGDGDITMSLYQFDNDYEKVFGPLDPSDAPEYTLMPRGSTALLDSTAKAIVDTGEFLSSLDESDRPDKVIFAIVTDGYENSSKEHNQASVKAMIETQTNNYSWDFMYIGCDVDAFAESRDLGIKYYTRSKSTSASAKGSYSALSSSLHSVRAGTSDLLGDTMPEEVDEDGNTTPRS